MQAAPGRCYTADEQVSEGGKHTLSNVSHYSFPSLRFNTDYDVQKKQHAQDVALTKATVKKLELQVESLKRALEEKVSWDRVIFTILCKPHTTSHTGQREGGTDPAV